MKKITTLFIALIFLASCASTGGKKTVEATQAKKGFLNGYYGKLEPGPKPVFDSPRNTESAFNYDIKHIDELEKMA